MKEKLWVPFQWGVGSHFGWGVYGLNLLLNSADDPDVLLIPSDTIVKENIVLDPLRQRIIRPAMTAADTMADMLRAHAGTTVQLAQPVLHGLGNQFIGMISVHDTWLVGQPTIGVLFMEDTNLDAESRDRGKDYALLVAGSTWNRSLLESAGFTSLATVFQGVDRTLFHPGPRQGLLPGRFKVFSGGKLEFRKGQDLTLLAFRAFHARHPEAMLVTAWHSPWPTVADSLTANARLTPVPYINDQLDSTAWAVENGIPAESFIDLGTMANFQLPTVLREMDVAVFPNRCEGGTNLVAMEAMACGLPTILSANSGHLDLIRDGVCLPLRHQGPVSVVDGVGTEGWGESDVEEIVESMEAVWRDRDAARRMGDAAATMMVDWSWEAQIDALKRTVYPYFGI